MEDSSLNTEHRKKCSVDTVECFLKLLVETAVIVSSLATIRILLYPAESPIDFDKSLLFSALYIELGLKMMRAL